MPVLIYSSAFNEKQYMSASRLIDAIFEFKKNKIVIERNRFVYVPSDGTRKMTIRLRRYS
jgi:hypothetical protein